MKKVWLLIIGGLFLVGCSCGFNSASGAVKKYLNNYRDYDASVEKSLDDMVDKMTLNEEQKDTYKEIFKRQYEDLKYSIEKETYDGDNAKVEVKITVYDLYAAQKEAETYMANHSDEFKTNNTFDNSKFTDYKLKAMKKQDKTVDYTLTINVEQKDNKWQVIQLTTDDLDKLNGIYNY